MRRSFHLPLVQVAFVTVSITFAQSLSASPLDVFHAPALEQDAGLDAYRNHAMITCFDPSADADRDGYTGSFAKGIRVKSVNGKCPAHLLTQSGDCNDRNAAIHPFNDELAMNAVDDNCNGRVDEISFVYPGTLASQTAGLISGAFQINNMTGPSAANLKATAHLRRLEQPDSVEVISDIRLSPMLDHPALEPAVKFEIPLGVHAADSVYSITLSVNGIDATGAEYSIESESVPFFGVTGSADAFLHARNKIVHKAIYEWDLSERGKTGYRGSQEVDGTRYGASVGEWWCSEFYAWVTGHWLRDMTGRADVSSLLSFFRGYSSQYPGTSIKELGQRGDYLAMDTDSNGDLNHSGMLLAIEETATGDFMWTLEGNWGNKTQIKRRALVPRNFRLGAITPEQLQQ